MQIDDYDNLPEGIGKEELSAVYDVFLRELEEDPFEVACKKIDILCDKQWHTYDLPSVDVQIKLQRWLLDNWRDSKEYVKLGLGVCYCFGLSKNLFRRFLDLYKGDNLWEYQNILNASVGHGINPYWSLEKSNQ